MFNLIRFIVLFLVQVISFIIVCVIYLLILCNWGQSNLFVFFLGVYIGDLVVYHSSAKNCFIAICDLF